MSSQAAGLFRPPAPGIDGECRGILFWKFHLLKPDRDNAGSSYLPPASSHRKSGMTVRCFRQLDSYEHFSGMQLPDNHRSVRARAYGIHLVQLAKRNTEGVAGAQREAGPDRRTEIERHPGDLVFPLSELVRHGPTNARITKALQRAQ